MKNKLLATLLGEKEAHGVWKVGIAAWDTLSKYAKTQESQSSPGIESGKGGQRQRKDLYKHLGNKRKIRENADSLQNEARELVMEAWKRLRH